MKKPNILMIVENFFPNDPRVRKETSTLKEAYNITIIAAKRNSKKLHQFVDGIEVFRIPDLKFTGSDNKNKFLKRLNKINYILQYFYFTAISMIIFLSTFIKRKYKIIHIHNPPDTLFIIGLLGKILSIRFIYDYHDLSPELYLSRFSKKKDFIYKVLILLEKLSCKLADVIITVNESCKQIITNRHHINLNKIHIVRNDPVIDEFDHENNGEGNAKTEGKNKRILLYLGAINPQDGLNLLLQSLNYLEKELSERNFYCYIIGDGDHLQFIKQKAEELNLLDYIDFKGFVSDKKELLGYLYSADICVEPASENEINKYSTFTKVMEYMAACKPIVAFDLPETRYSADGAAILVPPDDTESFARAIKKLLDEPELRKRLGKIGLESVQKELNWEKASYHLISAYSSLLLKAD